MAELESYAEKYAEWKDSVILIGVSSVLDEENAVIRHVKTKGWNNVLNVRVEAGAMKAYHVNALPTVYVIDQQGTVVGGSHMLDIPAIVNRLLAAK